METDLVISPFGASLADMLRVAELADAGGFAGVWTFDHFSGAVTASPWSRDPFVTLGALATATRRVRLGLLVANMANRHVAQLASGLNSLQSLAPDRIRCGIGSGAGPTGRFAVEQRSVGRVPGPASRRRLELIETIEALRVLYAGGSDYLGAYVTLEGASGIVDGAPCPDIVVGASGTAMIDLAAAHADGVNIRRTASVDEHLAHAARQRDARPATAGPFEISVFDDLDPQHALGGDAGRWREHDVARRTLVVSAPYPFEVIEAIGRRL